MDGGTEESVAGRGLRHDRSQTPSMFYFNIFFFISDLLCTGKLLWLQLRTYYEDCEWTVRRETGLEVTTEPKRWYIVWVLNPRYYVATHTSCVSGYCCCGFSWCICYLDK